jgi:hypothetical protein
MSLPAVNEIRHRIEQIYHNPIRLAFETALLLDARVGEIITKKHPSDLTANPTGEKLSVETTTYTPNLNNEKEFQTLMISRAMRGETTDFRDIAKIEEPAAVFTVSTEKRGGLIRTIGIPLNPKYEPWTKEIIEHFKDREGKPIFPFTRQQMYKTAQETFKGLHYTILPYKAVEREDGKAVIDPETKKTIPVNVEEHTKKFTNHALRHLRNVELRDFYGLTAEERSSYGGWTLRAMIGGIGSSIDRYGEAAWRPYFPKLLKKRV